MYQDIQPPSLEQNSNDNRNIIRIANKDEVESDSGDSSSDDDSDSSINSICLYKRKKRRKPGRKKKNVKRKRNDKTISKINKRRGRLRGSKNKLKVNQLIVVDPNTREQVGIIECEFKGDAKRISDIIKKYKDDKIVYQNKSLTPEASDIVIMSTRV